MRQSDIALDKYWVTQSDYFRLVTKLELGMGITYGKLLLCHENSDQSNHKTITIR